jgi:filamentous hemagglutinin
MSRRAKTNLLKTSALYAAIALAGSFGFSGAARAQESTLQGIAQNGLGNVASTAPSQSIPSPPASTPAVTTPSNSPPPPPTPSGSVLGASPPTSRTQGPISEASITPTSPGTNLDVAGNGVPVINIKKPDENGTSHNIYDTFNVGTEGLIFNNSNTNGTSILGGKLYANGNLIGGRAADLILNEITGGFTSNINGAVEIFGAKAALVIANPYGITCNGCGFINASRVTLATGRLLFDDSNRFSAIDVSSGHLEIAGAGLFGSNADYFDIISQTTKINANVYAKDLVVAAGNGTFNYAARTSQATASDEFRSNYVLDSSLLGGMYANKISIIGNGLGMGVNLEGVVVALEDSVVIEADGPVSVNEVSAKTGASITSRQGSVTTNGNLFGGASVNLRAFTTLAQNKGLIGSTGTIFLNASGDINLLAEGVYAGLTSEGKIEGESDLNITAGGTFTNRSRQIIASNTINILATSVLLGLGPVATPKEVSITLEKATKLDETIASPAQIAQNQAQLDRIEKIGQNRRARIIGNDVYALGTLVEFSSNLAPQGLILQSRQAPVGWVNLDPAFILNESTVNDLGGSEFTADDADASARVDLVPDPLPTAPPAPEPKPPEVSGAIYARNNFNLRVRQSADILSEITAGGNLAIDAGRVNLSGKLFSQRTIFAFASDQIQLAQSAVVSANQDIALGATNRLTSAATLSAGQSLKLTGGAVDLSGAVGAASTITLVAEQLNQSGRLSSGGQTSLAIVRSANIDGVLSTVGNVEFNAGSLLISDKAVLVSTGGLNLNVVSAFENRGAVSSAGNINFVSAGTITSAGSIESAGKLNIQAGEKFVATGRVVASGDVRLSGGAFEISALLASDANLIIDTATLKTRNDAILQARGNVFILSRSDVELGGSLYAGRDATITAARDIGSAGSIFAGQDVRLTSQADVRLAGTTAGSGNVSVSGRNITTSGDVLAGSALAIAASKTANLNGLTQATNISVTSSALNVAGDMAARENIAITAGSTNLAVSIRAGNDLGLNVAELTLTGNLVANRDIAINSATSLTVSNGAFSYAGGKLAFVSGGDQDISGALIAANTINIRAGGALRGNGGLQAGDNLAINARAIDFAGDVVSGANIALTATGDLRSAGMVSAANNVALVAGNDQVSNGILLANGSLTIQASNNATLRGDAQAGGSVSITGRDVTLAGNLTSQGATTLVAANNLTTIDTVFSAGDLSASAHAAQIDGQLASGGNLGIATSGTLNLSNAGLIYAQGALSLSGGDQVALAGVTQSVGSTSIVASALSIAGDVISGSSTSLLVRQTFSGRGTFFSAGDLNIKAAAIALDAQLASQRSISIVSGSSLDLGQSGLIYARNGLGLFASTSLQISGQVEVGGDATLRAANIAITNNFSSAGAISLIAGDTLSTSGAIFAGGNLEARAGSAIITGQFASGRDLILAASQTIDIGSQGLVYAGGNAALSSVGNSSLGGDIQTRGDSSLQAASLTIAGDINTGGALKLAASHSLTTSGAILANGPLDLRAGTAEIKGQLASSNDIKMDVGGNVNLGRQGFIYANNALNLASLGSVSLVGKVQAGNDINLRAAAISIDNDIVSGGSIRIDSAGGFVLSGSAFAAGDVNIRSGAATLNGQLGSGRAIDIVTSSTLTSGNAGLILAETSLNLNTSGALRLDGKTQAGGEITARGASLALNNDVNSGGNLDLVALANLTTNGNVFAVGDVAAQAGNVTIIGQLAAGNTMSLASAQALSQGGNSLVYAANGMSVTAGSSAQFDGKLQSGGTASLQAANLSIGGDITSSSDLILAARESLSTQGNVYASGAISLTAARASVYAQLASARDINVGTSGNFTLGNAGLIFAEDNVALAAKEAVTIDGRIQSNKDLIVKAAGIFIANDVASVGSLNLDALTTITSSGNIYAGGDLRANGGFISITGQAVSGGNLSIASSGGVNLGQAGLIFAGGTLDLSASSNAQLAGKIQSIGNASLAANTVSLAGELSSGGALSLSAANALSTGGTVFAQRDMNVSASMVSVGGQLASNASINIGSDGALTLFQSGLILASGSLNLAAGNAAQLNGTIQAGSDIIMRAASITLASDLSSGGALSLAAAGNITSSGTLSAQNGLSASGNNIAIVGQLASGRGVNLSAIGDVNLGQSGIVYTSGDLSLTAGGNAQLNGAVQSIGNTTISADNIAITNSLSSGGTLSVAATNTLATSGDIFAKNDINLSAGTVSLNAQLASEANINVASGNTLAVGQSGLINAGGGLNLAAGGDAQLDGAVQSIGNTSISAASLKVSSDLVSGGLLSMTASNSFTNNGNIFAVGDININAGSALLDAQVASRSNISLASQSTLNVGGNGLVQAEAGTVNLTSIGNQAIAGSVYSGGDQVYFSASALSYDGLIYAGGDIEAAAQDISISSDLVANGTANFAATNRFLSRGNIYGERGVGVRAGSARTEGGAIGANDDISIDVTRDISLTGNLASSNGVNLVAGENLTLQAASQVQAGAIELKASGNLTNQGGLASSTNITAQAGNSIDNDGSIAAGQDIAFTATTSDVRLGRASRISSIGHVSLVSNQSINIDGQIVSDNDVAATYGNEATLFGSIFTNKNVAFTNRGSGTTNLVGQVTALENVSISGGDLTLGGIIENAGNFSFTGDGARSQVSVTGQIRSDAGVSIDSAARISLGQTALVSSNQNVSLGAAVISIGGSIRSGGNITIASLANAGRVDISGLVLAGGNANITSRNGLILAPSSEIFAGGTASVSAANILAAGKIGATQVSLATLKTTAPGGDGNILVSGLINSADRIDIKGAGKVEIATTGGLSSLGYARDSGLGRDIGQFANISVVGADTVTNNGKIITDGSIFLNSLAGNVVNNVELKGATAVVLQALAGNIVENGGVATANLGLISGAEFINNKDFAISGSILIDARNIINNASLSASNNLYLVSATDINNFGVLRSGGNMALVAAGTINLTAAALPLPSAIVPATLGLAQVGQAEFVPTAARIHTLTPSMRSAQLQFGYLNENTSEAFQIEQAPSQFNNDVSRIALVDTESAGEAEASTGQVGALQTVERAARTTSVEAGGALLIQAGGTINASNVGVVAAGQIDLAARAINLTDTRLSNGVGAINLFAQDNIAIIANKNPVSIDAGGAMNLATGRDGAITLTNTSLTALGAVDIFTGTFAMTGQASTPASVARIDAAGISITATGALSLAGVELASRDSLRLGAGTNLSLSALTNITQLDTGGGNTTQATSVQGVRLIAANDLTLFARHDINLNAASLLAGGRATLLADNAINLTGTRDTQTEAKVWANGSSTSTTNSFIATTIESAGNLNLGARTINLEGAALVSGAGNIGLDGAGAINITAATSTFATTLNEVPGKRQTHSATSDGVIHTLTSLNAAGGITLNSGGALNITGGELIAAQNVSLSATNITASGVVDVINSTDQTYAKKKGFLSSKTTTTNSVSTDESVVLSTISGQNVTLRALGDINVLGTQTLAENDVVLDADGRVDITTLTENDFQNIVTKTKRSGFSIGNGGIFLGTKKTSNDTTQRAVVNTGSLLASNAGDVTIDADKDLVITGSQIFAANRVALYAEAINIRNALDTTTTNAIDKTSQTGLTLSMSSPLISSLDAIYQTTRTAATTRNDRVRVVSVAAAAVATRNAFDAVRAGGDLNTLASNVANGKATKLASLGQVKLSASLGTQSTRNETDTTSQTVLGSNISGDEIIMVARGAGSAGAITITGSTLEARNDLTASANGAIIIQSALERDTLNARSSSFNASIGVSAGSGGFSVDGAIGGSNGKVASTDTRFIESVVRAGGVLRIATPDAVRIEGGMVYGNQIVVNAGRLDIISQQDSSTYRSSNNSYGLQASVPIGAGSFSVSATVGRDRQRGDFLSVQEQSGLYAGSGGYDITVAGNTNLVGAVIASEADRSRNRLSTGTLAASNLENRETYEASSVNLSASLSGGGGAKPAADAKKPAGLATPLGNLTAGTPSAMSASGNQSSTTVAAIADGEITITSGDAASLTVANTISRDTSTANAPLTREYDDAKRQEIAQGFEATRTLTTQVATFFENRGREQAAAKTRKEGAQEDARKARENGNEDDALRYDAIAAQAKSDEDRLQATYASGSPVRILATAITGAASGNVTGSLESLGTAALVNVAQSLVTSKVKAMVEKIPNINARETTRAALQAVVACAGASASGGDCGASALGAATSVVLNNLLRTGQTPATDKDGKPLSLEEQQERTDLVVSLIAGLTLAGDGDVTSAANAGRIESENNAIAVDGANYQLVASNSAEESRRSWQRFFTSEQGKLALEVYASERATKSCLGNGSSASCNASQQKLNTLITAFGDAKTVNQQLNAFLVDDLVGIASSALQIIGPQNAPAFLGDVMEAADGSPLKTRQILVAIETGQYTWTGLRNANRDQSIADGGKFVSNFLSPAQPYTISADGKLGCYAGGALCIPGDQARRFNAIMQTNDLQFGIGVVGLTTAGGGLYLGAPAVATCLGITACVTGAAHGTAGAGISWSVDTSAKRLVGEEQTLGGGLAAASQGFVMGAFFRKANLRNQISVSAGFGGLFNGMGQGVDMLIGQIDPKTGQRVTFSYTDPFLAAGTSALGTGIAAHIPDVGGRLVQKWQWEFYMNTGRSLSLGQISRFTASNVIRDGLKTAVDVPYNATVELLKKAAILPMAPVTPAPLPPLSSPNPATNPPYNRQSVPGPTAPPNQGR